MSNLNPQQFAAFDPETADYSGTAHAYSHSMGSDSPTRNDAFDIRQSADTQNDVSSYNGTDAPARFDPSTRLANFLPNTAQIEPN